MSALKQKLQAKIEEQRPRIINLVKNYSDVVVDNVTIGNLIGGMRGLKCLVSDISYLDPEDGIRYRGCTLDDVFTKLPKPKGSEMPYVEGLFFLLLTGDIPTKAELDDTLDEFSKRRIIPRYIYELIDAFPCCTHPMTIFSSAILTMNRESIFNRKYIAGVSKYQLWESMYEDVMNMLAKLPEIAAYIYAKLYNNNNVKRVHSNPNIDMAANFAHMMGKESPYDDVARMHFIIHSDHESGNVSAHTGHLVASSLSSIYLSTSSMINGLAGPLHGLASQNVLKWLQEVQIKMGGQNPTESEMKQFVWDTLNSGQVIPGFGHAVLRKTDPRYKFQRDFSIKHLKNDPLFKYVDMLYKVVPPILQEHGKAKNPWPNVDAQSGVIQWFYGIKEYDFYTVLFGIGRAIGVSANIIWDRALGLPIERPKSLTTTMLEDIAFKTNKKK